MAPRMRIETDSPSTTTSNSKSVGAAVQAPKVRIVTGEAPEPKAVVPTQEPAPASEPQPSVATTLDAAPAVPSNRPKVKARVMTESADAGVADDGAQAKQAAARLEEPLPARRADAADGGESPSPEASSVREQPDKPKPEAGTSDGAARGKGCGNVFQRIGGWVHATFPGHEHAFWGGVVAMLVALLVFAIGVLRVLLIGVLVLIGVALGQVLDGDPKIIRAVRDLFSNDREQQ